MMDTSMKDGSKWSRTQSMGANRQGGNRGRRGQEGLEESSAGTGTRGRILKTTVSWHEDRAMMLQAESSATERNLTRKNSRSDAPGRWDNNKEDVLGLLVDKRQSHGPQRWPSYGHRDQKNIREEMDDVDLETLFPPPRAAAARQEQLPPWLHYQESRDPDKANQSRKSAAEFEQQRLKMKESLARGKKEPLNDGNSSVKNSQLMSEEEINKFKKELEAEDRAMSGSGVFTFDSLKEALKSQGLVVSSSLPPMPGSSTNTVDQIEKLMKTSTNLSSVMQPTVTDIEKQRTELQKIENGQRTGNLEGTNSLLSMLKGQNKPPTGSQNQKQATQTSLQDLLGAGGTSLERFFGTSPRPVNLQGGLVFGQQRSGLGTAPFMQQGMFQGQTSTSGGGSGSGSGVGATVSQQNPLLAALVANQTQPQVNQKQMTLMFNQSKTQNHELQSLFSRSAGGNERAVENGVQQSAKTIPLPFQSLGFAPQSPGIGTNKSQIPAFPIMGTGRTGPVQQGGLGKLQELFMKNGGGGLGDHSTGGASPGLSSVLAFSGIRPNTGSIGVKISLPNMWKNNSNNNNNQGMNFQASILAATQQQQSANGLDRFFGAPGINQGGTIHQMNQSMSDSIGGATRQSLEEVKNEAQ
eukprot:g8254.t1